MTLTWKRSIPLLKKGFYIQIKNHSTVSQTFLRNIYEKNDSFSSTLTEEQICQLLEPQKPDATLLSCCDSRVPLSSLGLVESHKVFVVRNIGNQYLNSKGSFRFGVESLKTPLAIVMGHTNCGAIKASLQDYRDHHTMIQSEVLGLVRMIRYVETIKGTESMLMKKNFDEKCNIYSEINVDYQIMQLMKDWQIANRVFNDKLNIIGMVFDIHNVYNEGHGKAHIVNINGDRDINSMKSNDLLAQLDDEHKNDLVKRLFYYQTPIPENVGITRSYPTL